MAHTVGVLVARAFLFCQGFLPVGILLAVRGGNLCDAIGVSYEY